MKANELQIINFLQDPMYNSRIPVSKELRLDAECKELLNDIISVETEIEGTHFIGSIVFVHEGTYTVPAK
jgi:hypothetical protein